MGKKRSWFSAVKRVFTPHCKEKLGNVHKPERKSGKEKRKKGFGGETNTFLPIFREPSSIEKILGEAERDHNLVFKPPTPPDQSNPSSASPPRPASSRAEPSTLDTPRPLSPKPPSPREASPRLDSPRLDSPRLPFRREASSRAEPPRLDTPRPPSPRAHSPRAVSPRTVQLRENVDRPKHTLLVQHASATKIQGAFSGYMARRRFRALKGLVRLQGVMRGCSVKRQTVNAMKHMHQVVRLQYQIQSRRIKMLENQAQVERDEVKWAAGNDHWDDSVLTNEERDARSQRKIDAIIKRERSMAYAYSHKLWKNSHKSSELPLRWDKQLPLASPVRSHSQPLRDYKLTPTRLNPSPLSQSSNQYHFRLDNNFDASTPKSSRSSLLTPSKPIRKNTSRYSRGSLRGQDSSSPFKDDGSSLTSCPPYPSYMAPTVSAKAKARPKSNPKERVMTGTTPVSNETRRMSYPPTQQDHNTFRWNKGSLLMSNSSDYKKSGHGSPESVVLEKQKTVKSVGNLSINSTASMPRKPFNRFV